MFEPPDEVRRALREVALELGRAVEQGGRLAMQAADDLARLVGDPRLPAGRTGSATDVVVSAEPGPIDAIRRLGALRDEGLITPEEFEAKKAELLARL